MNLRFSLLSLIGLTTFAALASAALVHPGIGWTSVIVTLVVATFTWQVLRVLLTTGETRAAGVGWLVFAIGYLALVLAPWLSNRVGPRLLSSQALNYAQINWRHEDPAGGLAEYQRHINLDLFGVPFVDATSNNSVWLDVSGNGSWMIPTSMGSSLVAANPVAANHFQLSGHWLCAWLAGWLGSLLAVHFQRRRQIDCQVGRRTR
jgi:hypothetical protein